MSKHNGTIEEIVIGVVGIMVIISLLSVFLSDVNFSSTINTTLFGFLLFVMISAVLIKVVTEIINAF